MAPSAKDYVQTARQTTFYRPTFFHFSLALLAIGFTNPLGDFPLNDDWQYAYLVKVLLENDWLDFQGIFAPNILLQIAWGDLFCKIAGGVDFTWLRFSALAAAIIALAVFFTLCKKAGLTNQKALLGTWMLGLNPLFFALPFLSYQTFPSSPLSCSA